MKDETKLVISIIIDVIGMAGIIPIVGEFIDIADAPIEAVWIFFAYHSTRNAILGGIEELIPYVDLIPMCTISHFLYLRENKVKKRK